MDSWINMDKKEADFNAKLLETFKIEAEEHIKALSNGLIALEKQLTEELLKEWIEKIFREAHSLKGAARSVGFDEIQNICQAMENVLAFWKQNKKQPSKESIDAVYATIDFISRILVSNCMSSEDKQALPLLLQRLDELLKSTDSPVSALAPQENNTKSDTKSPPEDVQNQSNGSENTLSNDINASQVTIHDKTIRVSLHKLDKLLQQVEEMLMLKLAARQQFTDLKKMREEFRQWEKKWGYLQEEVHIFRQSMETGGGNCSDANLPGRVLDFIDWQQQFIKSITDQLNSLIRMTAHDYRLAGVAVDTLLEDTKKVLMQPFSTLRDTLPRMIRDLSHELGKEIHFQSQGEDIEVDRRILEEMKDPIIHLIRNCIDHGIGKPEERIKANKPRHGIVKMSISQVGGNSMELIVSDDGKGINVERVKASAIKQGIVSAKDAELLDERAVLSLIFHSGISTSSVITELSGRGLGLGIVAEKVDKLGGHVSVETKLNEGTTFKILLPLTLATFRGIHIKVGGLDYIMPTHNVKRIFRIKKEEIKTVENRQIVYEGGKTLSLMSLADLLGIPPKEHPRHQEFLPVIIVKTTENMIAFGIDQVLHEQEVLVKGLGKQLARVPNILAATVTEWGQVIPILNPQDLVKSAKKGKNHSSRPIEDSQEEKNEEKKLILVAEDSISSRMFIKNILESVGYTVKAAVDGVEAFSFFKNEPIHLLLSDVEMPRMDGFTLTEKVRSTEKGKKIPIILCTTRESKEDRERGIEVGANAYLDKSSFTPNNLLNVIQKLL